MLLLLGLGEKHFINLGELQRCPDLLGSARRRERNAHMEGETISLLKLNNLLMDPVQDVSAHHLSAYIKILPN